MIYRIFKIILLFVLISAFIMPSFKIIAETSDPLQICESPEEIDKRCKDLAPSECRKLLEECQEYFEEKSLQIEKDITKTQQEKKTLQNQIYILSNKVKNLNYQIYQSNVVIKDLGFQIEDTKNSIEKTSSKISQSCEKLIFILRAIYEEDQKSLVEIFLAEEQISDFFSNLVALEELSTKNRELLQSIKELKNYLEGQMKSLDEEKQDLENLVTIQTLQKQESENTKKEREYFLKWTEAEYQEHLKEKEKTAQSTAEIRARIFELIGVPEAPTFGEAYEIAKFVSAQTGIRPALLLAVLTQESNIGKNVGQCYLKNSRTGSGVVAYNGKEISRVMNPTRDVPHFLEITKGLGRDPYNTPVSCPMSVGWGGAMGPAQFIPSTWMMYKDRIAELKRSPADPWNISDAFLAAAVYLADVGATKKTYEYEWCAALSYFCGSCSLSNQIRYEFYGDSVMAIAAQYEEDIKELEKS